MRKADAQIRAVPSFRAGLFLMAEGAAFLRRERRLWLLALVPILFATILVAIAVSIFWMRLDLLREFSMSILPVLEAGSWWSWLWIGPGKLLVWLVGWLIVVLAFAFSLIVALLLANLASAPFLDQLSKRVEDIVLGTPDSPSGGFLASLGETGKSFLAELQRLVFIVAIWTGLGFVGLIVPGAQVVTGPLLIAVTILLMPLDYAGFALDRRQISFRARRRWIWSHWPMMTGFGGSAFVACLVPGLNLLMMPALVTAGTLLVLRVAPDPAD